MLLMQFFNIFLIIFSIFFIYFPTIFFGLICDDTEWYRSVEENVFTRGKNLFQQIITRFYGGGTFSTNTKIDHITSISLHSIVCILIYFVFGHNYLAFLVAIMYGVNPSNHQTAIWLTGRRYVICIILSLLAILAGPYGLPLYLFTGCFHYTSAFLPVIMMNKWYYIFWLVIYFAVGIRELRNRIKGRRLLIFDNEMKQIFNLQRIVIITKCYGFGFFKMFGFGKQLMLYPDLEGWGLTDWGNKRANSLNIYFYKGIAAYVLTILSFIFFKEDRLTILFIFLGTIQWCALIPSVQLNADRYFSLVNVFFTYLLWKMLFNILNPIIFIFISSGMLIYYVFNLNKVFKMYKDLTSFYLYQIKLEPKMVHPRVSYITDLVGSGKVADAWDCFIQGLKHNPKDYSVIMIGVIVSICSGNKPFAMGLLQSASKNLYRGKEKDELEEIYNLKQQVMKIPDGNFNINIKS